MNFHKELEFKNNGIVIRTYDKYDTLFNEDFYSNSDIEDMQRTNKTIEI